MPSCFSTTTATALFTDVSQQTAKVAIPERWGVVARTINNDGFLDLFVATDTTAQFHLRQSRWKAFEAIGFYCRVPYGKEEQLGRAWVDFR